VYYYLFVPLLVALGLVFILPFVPVFSQPPRLDRSKLGLLVVGLLLWTAAGGALSTPRQLLLGVLLSASAVYDLAARVIPNRLLAVLAVLAVGVIYASARSDMLNLVLAAVVCLVVMTILGIAGRGALGAGDVKLCAVIGLLLGLDTGLALIALSFLLLMLPAIYFVVSGKGIKRHLPFAPFVWAAGMLFQVLSGGRFI